MKVAVIGSRSLTVQNLEEYLPQGVTEIVSGGAKGIDTCAKEYAHQAGLKLTEFLPDYQQYGRSAPLRRNLERAGFACSPGISDCFGIFPLVGQGVSQWLFADRVAREREGAFVGEP